jgi:tetratricopeptide (TPR) repeat protein
MLFHLGMAERAGGHLDEAIAAWREAIEIDRRRGDTTAIGQRCPIAVFDLIWAARWMDAYQLAEQALAALGDEIDSDRGRLLAVAGICVAGAGRDGDGVRSIAEALEMADRVGDDALKAHALTWKAGTHHVYMENRDTVDAGLRAADLLRASGELWLLSVSLGLVAFSLPSVGRLQDARQVSAEGQALAERLGNHGTLSHCRRAIAMVDWAETGDLRTLEAFGHRDRQLCRDAGLPWDHGAAAGWRWRASSVATGTPPCSMPNKATRCRRPV